MVRVTMNNGVVQANVDGNFATTEFAIVVNADSLLNASDFYL